MSEEKEKPDGWVAYHGVEGFLLITAARCKSHSEDRLLEKVFQFEFDQRIRLKDAFHAARELELQRATNDGWRIRPVKLVFLDEPKVEEGKGDE